jgi:hypothetical protein
MQEHIEELSIAGLESGEMIEVNDEWWQQKRLLKSGAMITLPLSNVRI